MRKRSLGLTSRGDPSCAGLGLTPDTLAILQIKSGEALSVTQGDDGFVQMTTRDRNVMSALAAAEIVMTENHRILGALV